MHSIISHAPVWPLHRQRDITGKTGIHLGETMSEIWDGIKSQPSTVKVFAGGSFAVLFVILLFAGAGFFSSLLGATCASIILTAGLMARSQ